MVYGSWGNSTGVPPLWRAMATGEISLHEARAEADRMRRYLADLQCSKDCSASDSQGEDNAAPASQDSTESAVDDGLVWNVQPALASTTDSAEASATVTNDLITVDRGISAVDAGVMLSNRVRSDPVASTHPARPDRLRNHEGSTTFAPHIPMNAQVDASKIYQPEKLQSLLLESITALDYASLGYTAELHQDAKRLALIRKFIRPYTGTEGMREWEDQAWSELDIDWESSANRMLDLMDELQVDPNDSGLFTDPRVEEAARGLFIASTVCEDDIKDRMNKEWCKGVLAFKEPATAPRMGVKLGYQTNTAAIDKSDKLQRQATKLSHQLAAIWQLLQQRTDEVDTHRRRQYLEPRFQRIAQEEGYGPRLKDDSDRTGVSWPGVLAFTVPSETSNLLARLSTKFLSDFNTLPRSFYSSGADKRPSLIERMPKSVKSTPGKYATSNALGCLDQALQIERMANLCCNTSFALDGDKKRRDDVKTVSVKDIDKLVPVIGKLKDALQRGEVAREKLDMQQHRKRSTPTGWIEY